MKTLQLAATIQIFLAANAFGNTLYTNQAGWLHIVNQTTGSALQQVGSCSCNFSANDLEVRPGTTGFLYGVVNSNSSSSRLTKLNVANGHHELFPVFSDSAIGIAKSFADGIAISPLQPNVAIITGFDSDFLNGSPTAGQHFVWTVDLNSGSVLSAGIPNPSNVGVITYSVDGTTIYGVDENGRLVTLNPTSGLATLIGDPGLSDFIEGLAFRPNDGALFAIDGFTADNLVIINPSNGTLISSLGSLHLGGAHGLAFVIPEPSSALLAASIFALLASRGSRR
jgi:hypothetical protein